MSCSIESGDSISPPEVTYHATVKRITFPQSKNGDKEIDVVETSLITDVALAYIAGGRRLFLIGSPVAEVNSKMVGFCWDGNSLNLVKKLYFGLGG